ncbi:MAG: serine/threonine-protein kinase [Gaiellaceae bacterium]
MQVSSDVFPERYRDPVRVGHGAMGDVYRAHDELLDRDVAIKLLAQRFAEDPEIRARFAREGLAAARLSAEPGIVTVFDVGEANGRPFIVMELVPRGSLAERLAEGPPPVGRALEWLEGAARALDAGHRRGVVHRDVKPGNLLLDAADRVHVADFGVASAAGLESLTMTGTILGTAGYLSPEQAAGGRATPASDRYGLAVVAWELLSGRRPFAAESATAEAAAHVHDPPPSLHGTRADLPWSELDAVFARALAKDPAERPASCAELVDQLRSAFLSASTTTRIVAPAPVAAPSSSRRRRPAVGLVAVALTALLAGGALAVALARRGDETRSTPSTSVQTVRVTRPGTTVTRQVTVTAPTTAPTTSPTTTPPPPPAGVSATSLTDQATALLRAGRYEKAAAKAQQALETLRGTGQLYEAYALYDLGASLAGLGDCKNAKKALDQSQKIQGHRSEIDAAKRACKGH